MAGTRSEGGFSEDVERLFQGQVPSVPTSSGYQPAAPGLAGSSFVPAVGTDSPTQVVSTLDESVWTTVYRDLKRIYANLLLVVFPFKNRDRQSAALRNWDLWGPMVFTLTLAICLSVGSHSPSNTFSLVFTILSAGAVILTVNVVLLGGNIGFFQSMCLLGYCIFPLDIAAILCLFISNAAVRWVAVSLAVAWSGWASVPFIGGSVSPARKALAVYPLLLLYTSVAWLALIKG